MNALRMGMACLCVLGLWLGLGLERAQACGGLFCNLSQPVNQAAERILFVDNGDGTITDVIEIKYDGPSSKFSWVLPVPGVPTVAVSSTSAFDRLQTMSDPQYMLTTTFETCASSADNARSASVPTGNLGMASKGAAAPPQVAVLAAGTVGPYDYQVIMVDPSLSDRADVAVKWLTDNGYDVGDLGPSVLRPYLDDNLNLLAFRLTKDSMTGSIRPVVVTLTTDKPFIPIRPTAVAADDNMGVMVFVAGRAHAIPSNYKALELNEARINWFMPMSNYNDVVSAAADEAGGRGFVTEYAEPTVTSAIVLQPFEQQEWQQFSTQTFTSLSTLINAARPFANFDGFADALRMNIQGLPTGVTIQDVINCPNCYESMLQVDTSALQRSLYELVWKPMAATEMLLHSQPFLTRFYTTMSADEMTEDPSFDYNADLANYSNVHTAMQTIACDQSWTVTLPQGDVVAGKSPSTWPSATAMDEPAARKIRELATSGSGKVVVDNSAKITKTLVSEAKAQGVEVVPAVDGGTSKVAVKSSGGCRVEGGRGSLGAALLELVLCALYLAARRRRAH